MFRDKPWIFTHDYLRTSVETQDGDLLAFRLYDDDGLLYYEGYVFGEENALDLLRWSLHYAGCTRLELARVDEGGIDDKKKFYTFP